MGKCRLNDVTLGLRRVAAGITIWIELLNLISGESQKMCKQCYHYRMKYTNITSLCCLDCL